MAGKNPLLHSIHHFLVGFVLTIKGYNKLSHHNILGGIILAFGIIILLYFFYVLRKKHPDKKLNLLILGGEAVASLLTAYIYFEEGATYLPYVFLLAAVGFFISIFVSMAGNRTNH